MKILFVTPYYKPYLGGIERVIEQLAIAYQELGHEVAVLTTKWEFPNDPSANRMFHADWANFEVSATGECIYRIGSFPNRAPAMYQVPLVWFHPSAFQEVIEDFDPDVIQLMNDRWFVGNFWAWFWSGGRTVAFSLSFHAFEKGGKTHAVRRAVKWFLRPVNAFLTRVTDWTHVITEHEKGLVRKAYWTPNRKMTVIPWGVSFPADVSGNRDDGIVHIIAVGRVCHHKGQRWLASVVKRVASITQKQVELVIIGKDDGYGHAIRSEFPSDDFFTLVCTGPVSDGGLAAWYEKADIFALFPEYEAFGLVFLEAMAHGVPVVTHDVGAIRDVLQDAATIIEPYNEAQAQVVLARLVDHPKEREALGVEGQAFVHETYSWQKTAQSFIVAYESHET